MRVGDEVLSLMHAYIVSNTFILYSLIKSLSWLAEFIAVAAQFATEQTSLALLHR